MAAEFWQSNGLPELTGFYANGKKGMGSFTVERSVKSYTEKSFRNDKLDGNFTLYYPASNSDSSRFFEKLQKVRSEKSYFSWKNLKKIFSGSKVDPNEIKVTNHLRLKPNFKKIFRRTLSGLLSPG